MIRRIALLFALSAFVGQALAQGDFQKGISLYKQGQFAKAAQEFELLVKAEPEYEAGFRVLGDCYLKLKDWAKASTAFRKALALKQDQFASYLGAATADFNLGRFEDCATELVKGERLAKNPKEKHQLLQLRGSAYYRLGRHRQAVSDLEAAIGMQRPEFRDLLQLGVSQFRVGNYPAARKYLEQAKGLQPASKEAGEFLDQVDFAQGVQALGDQRYDEAAALLGQLVARRADHGEGWYNLGLAQLLGGKQSEAEGSFRRSAELLPTNWEAFNRLGYICEMQKRYPEALQHYKKASEMHADPALAESVKRIQERIRRQQNS